MLDEMMDVIQNADQEIARAMQDELWRQRNHIELIASENLVSPAVLAAAGSVLTNKYAEGYPGKRFYGGCEYVDVVEKIAIDRAKLLFNAEFANVQAHSGSQANFSVYLALCKPGDTVMGMDLGHGGHLTHGSPANFSGKFFNIVSYGVNPETGVLDYDEVLKVAKEHRPKMIIAGASSYPRILDFQKFGEIAAEVGAYLCVDIAHIAGLIAGGEHPSPLPYADVVTSTTHKTLRGPRGGLVLTNNGDIARKINSAIFPGSQGGPLMHIIAAKAIAFAEALKPEFTVYQQQIVKNAQAMAETLLERGMNLVTGGTDNHLMLMDLRGTNLTGLGLEQLLDHVQITANKNKVPNDPLSATDTSGLRLGTPFVTSRGFLEAESRETAELICMVASDFDANRAEVIERVEALCSRFPIYGDV